MKKKTNIEEKSIQVKMLPEDKKELKLAVIHNDNKSITDFIKEAISEKIAKVMKKHNRS